MIEILSQSPRLPAHVVRKRDKEKFLFLDPDKPSWVVTNSNGAAALNLCNGRRTIDDICRIMAKKMGNDRTSHLLEFFTHLIVEKKFFSAPEPYVHSSAGLQSVHLNLTNRCNLQCIYCYASDRGPSPDSLSREDWFAVIDSINRINKKVTIEITGGEPLLAPHVFDIGRVARQKGNVVHLLTNGLLIDEAKAAAIANTFDLVRISLDGSTSPIHDYHRGAGSFDAVMRAIDLLMHRKVAVQLAMTVTKKNVHDLRATAARFGSLVTFAPLFRTRRTRHHRELWITGKEYYHALSSVPGVNPLSCLYSCLESASEKRIMKCAVGDGEISISNTGDVYPCHLLHAEAFLAGNVQHVPLEKIYYESAVLQSLRHLDVDHIKGCSACDIRFICGGACRARAFYEKDRIDVADDFCAYEKLAFLHGLFELHSID